MPYSGDVIVEVSGGTYTDEATNQSTTLTTPLKVVITANGSAVTGVVTPLTTMAYTYAFGSTGTPTAAAFNTMASSVATQFKLTGVNLATTVPTVSGTMNDYGKVLAAVSKYLQTNSVTLSGQLINGHSSPANLRQPTAQPIRAAPSATPSTAARWASAAPVSAAAPEAAA